MPDKSPIPVFHYPRAARIGLIADTHVPDRAAGLYPSVQEIFSNVDLILHGGDITTAPVLEHLSRMAPTLAVRGNNRGDRLFDPPLPEKCIVQVAGGIQIVMWHGMKTFWHRLTDFVFGRAGFFNMVANRMIKRCVQTLPDTNIVFFGHLHWPKLHFTGDRLFVNPGRAFSKTESSCAVMEIKDRVIRIRIHPLTTAGRFEHMIHDWHVFHLYQKNPKAV
ncbi:YfcE family phosphodiesterase [bacterium]|nr:YfcE family phosphodiesterase [bacterium]